MKNKMWRMGIVLILGALMAGCAHLHPLAYHDDNQIPQGPGLLSGEDGAFSLQFDHLGLNHTNNSTSNQTDPNNGE